MAPKLAPETLAFEMAQKKKCAASHGHGNLANRKAKKSILKPNIIITNTEKFDQISNGEEESTRKFNLSRCQRKKKKKKNQICKGKSISNDNTHQMEIHQVTRIHFQEEIMMDILRRLPVRSLLRFKCVSKFWKSLINDPYFRRTHYIHNRDDQNSQKLLTIERLFMKDFDFYTCSSSMREDKQKLDWPSSCKPKIALIFCSCDGLVLTLVSSGGYYEELVLWNPSTRESRLLPHPEFPVRTCVCGLEYDATSEDYKILAISLNAIDSSYTSIQLFSLKSGSWRRIGYPTGIKPKPVRGFMDSGMDYLAFLHGAFHWLAMSCSGYYTTVSFNISNEVYGEVPLLEQMFGVSPRYYIIDHGVSVLRGMLCFYCTHNHWTEGRIGTFKLWIMKDYGVRESWTKLIEIRDTNLFHSARPKYMFADCEVLLQCKGNRCCNSIFTTSRGPFKLCPKCNITKRGIVYAESFISPNSLT